MDVAQIRCALAENEQKDAGNAVLIPLVPSERGLSVLLEVRATSLAVQPGEVCLPGGRIEDGERPVDAAVRETCEELLVDPSQLELLGSLGTMEGAGGQPLHVFVASLSDYKGSYSESEVERTFYLTLDWLAQHRPTTYSIAYEPIFPADFPWELVPNGRSYPWRTKSHGVPFYEGTEPVVWGATARVLDRFMGLLHLSGE